MGKAGPGHGLSPGAADLDGRRGIPSAARADGHLRHPGAVPAPRVARPPGRQSDAAAEGYRLRASLGSQSVAFEPGDRLLPGVLCIRLLVTGAVIGMEAMRSIR